MTNCLITSLNASLSANVDPSFMSGLSLSLEKVAALPQMTVGMLVLPWIELFRVQIELAVCSQSIDTDYI